MKKVIAFLSSPVINLIIGLVLYFSVGSSIFLYDSFDRRSAFYGGLFVIALDIFSNGFVALYKQHKSKKESLGSS